MSAVLTTGLHALDEVLTGGLLQGGVYIIDGTPGVGKTVLANQICFRHTTTGGRALFITLLAESHTRMLQHMSSTSFYDESAMPDRLYYISGTPALAENGLKGFIDLVRRELKRHNPGVLVVDGFSMTQEFATSQHQYKTFVQELQSHAAASDCVMLLLTTGGNIVSDSEYTMVDGILQLSQRAFDRRVERSLQVLKLRGKRFLEGAHPFRITADGIVLFPRIEAMFHTPSVRDEYSLVRQTTGVAGIDDLLKGGLLAQTTTGLFGPTGIGKTTFGLQYIGQSSTAEPGLFFTFFEGPDRLRTRAASMGIDLKGLEQRGAVEIIWRPQGEQILDEIGQVIIETVRRRGMKRMFIDGFGGLAESAINSERLTRFVSVLSNEIRALGVTTVVSIESRNILGASMDLPSAGLSSLLEGLILLRYAEVEGQIRRLISITKIRDSDFDPFLHEFKIISTGIEVGGVFRGFEALLSGFGREPKLIAENNQYRTPPHSADE